MLVEEKDRDVEESEEERPAKKTTHSVLRVRAGLDEEYSPDEIAKMTELYEGTTEVQKMVVAAQVLKERWSFRQDIYR